MKTACVLLADDHAPARCGWPSERRRGKVFLPADFRFCLIASGGRRRETGLANQSNTRSRNSSCSSLAIAANTL
jgi:hypothetical protein